MNFPRLVIGGAGSGAGKTTVAAGLMAALVRRGFRVQGFKAGPDYIDPTYHRLATGRPSRNLDTWLLGPERVREVFHRGIVGADVAFVEGVMGLFDGHGGEGDAGSTAHLAQVLAAPVVLVVDAHGMGRSTAAVVRGFRDFDPAVRVAGVILNRVGSPGHARLLRETVEGAAGLPVLGCLPADAAVCLPERHLGLVPAGELAGTRELEGAGRGLAAVVERLASLVAEHVDLEAVLRLARSAGHLAPPETTPPAIEPAEGDRVRIGLARDAAFHFYYQDAIELLETLGADMVPFSPLANRALPSDLDGLFIGGGFPEVFAGRLAANMGMLASVRRAAADGMPVYAECGGLMYLCRSLADAEGREHALAGVVPARAVMTGRLAGLGYREAEAARDSLLFAPGERARGHEFHHATVSWDEAPDVRPHAYTLRRQPGEPGAVEGWARGNVLASFLHLHFCAVPESARRFVTRCRAFRSSHYAGSRRGAMKAAR